MSFSTYGVHAAGAALATTSGFAFFSGACVLWQAWVALFKKQAEQEDKEPDYARLLRQASFVGLGGAAFTFGVFAFVPRVFREVWKA